MVEISVREATVIVMGGNQRPAEMLLANDVRLGYFALRVQRLKILIEYKEVLFRMARIPGQLFMNKFRKLGFVAYNGREVHSSPLNAD